MPGKRGFEVKLCPILKIRDLHMHFKPVRHDYHLKGGLADMCSAALIYGSIQDFFHLLYAKFPFMLFSERQEVSAPFERLYIGTR